MHREHALCVVVWCSTLPCLGRCVEPVERRSVHVVHQATGVFMCVVVQLAERSGIVAQGW